MPPVQTRAAAGRRGLVATFARYLASGGTAAVVDFGGFLLLVGAGAGIVFAAAVSFILAVVVNFLLSAHFVFGAAASRKRFLLFFVCAVAGLAINTGVTAASVMALGLPAAFGKLCGIAVAFIFNFLVNATIVFPADRRAANRQQGVDPA